MQKAIQITTMPPPNNSMQETEISNETTHPQELEKPFPLQNSSESKNSQPDEESAEKSHETTAAQKSDETSKKRDDAEEEEEEEEVEEGVRATTAPRKSDATVEDGSSSGRERLKRHRVEVAGRVWIPDMWGQEDFLKDWIDCAAFDASLVNSRIMLARDSLVEEARRANSTRLRIENSC